MYKYLFKLFNNKINKKKYNLQIWQYNTNYTIIIILKDVIILEKIRGKKKLSRGIIDIIMLAKIAQISSFVDLIRRYK